VACCHVTARMLGQLVCCAAGAIVFSLWTNSTSVEELIHTLQQERKRKDLAGHVSKQTSNLYTSV
jgi:hypothetical protein